MGVVWGGGADGLRGGRERNAGVVRCVEETGDDGVGVGSMAGGDANSIYNTKGYALGFISYIQLTVHGRLQTGLWSCKQQTIPLRALIPK